LTQASLQRLVGCTEERPSSVTTRCGQLKRVLDQLAARFGLAVGDYFDHVEAVGDFGIVEHSEPDLGAARDLALLKPGDGFERTAQVFVGPGFYFHEHQCVAIAADNIDLTAGAVLEISVQNLVAALAEESTRRLLAFAAADVFPIAR
jgi:hypothetical protein